MSERKIFWTADEQAERLSELTSADEQLKELPLRRDVQRLPWRSCWEW